MGDQNNNNNGKTFKMIYRVLVLILLVGILYRVSVPKNEDGIRDITEKLKYDLEYLKSEQSKSNDNMGIIQEKLKYDLEFIKATQATAEENHDILVEILKKQK